MVKKSFLLLFSLILAGSGFSQNVSAFIDYRNYLMVFDNGTTYQAEYLPVKDFKVGGNAVAYIDNSDNFKVFYAGEQQHLADVAPTKYLATDDIVAYNIDKIMYVFDNGKATRIPGWADNFVAGDSIMGFFDTNSGYYKVYYGGSIEQLPDMLDDASLTTFKAGDNILAYVNVDGKYKAYFHGKVYDLGTNHVSMYDAGANTIAFMDDYTNTFKVFYAGTIAPMETLAPKSMKVGDDLIAYVDASGSFKIFYKGALMTLTSYDPDFYTVVDNVVVYGMDNTNFNVFYKGKVYQLEKTIPTDYQLDMNSVAYTDSYGYLKLFSDGITQQAYTSKVESYALTKNVLMFKTGMSDYHFILNGKTY